MLFVQIWVLMYYSYLSLSDGHNRILCQPNLPLWPQKMGNFLPFFCIPFPSKNNTPVKGKVQFPPSSTTWCFVRSRVERSGVPALEQPEFWRWKKWTRCWEVGLEKFVVESSVFSEVFSKLLTFQSTRMSIQSYYNHSLQMDPHILISLLHI